MTGNYIYQGVVGGLSGVFFVLFPQWFVFSIALMRAQNKPTMPRWYNILGGASLVLALMFLGGIAAIFAEVATLKQAIVIGAGVPAILQSSAIAAFTGIGPYLDPRSAPVRAVRNYVDLALPP